MIEQVKELRVNIDGLAQLTKELKPIELDMNDYIQSYSDLIEYPNLKYENKKLNSKEIEKAVDSLYLAKTWLGKVFGKLGAENPYKSGYKTVKDIESTADVAKLNDFITTKLPSDENVNLIKIERWKNKNHIEKVDWLRTEIKKVANTVLELNSGKLNQKLFSEYEEKLQWCSYQYLSEARFWLGFELQRIKDNENAS
jgi:hypothetical protein